MAQLKEKKSESWEAIKQRYPDSFVLLENPEFKPRPHLHRGIFVYKNKNKKMVCKKAVELNIGHCMVQYTGGKRLDEIDENTLIL
jgi:hypothetical protein